MVDVGQTGSTSDGGVWDKTTFGQAWRNGKYKICQKSIYLMLCFYFIYLYDNLFFDKL